MEEKRIYSYHTFLYPFYIDGFDEKEFEKGLKKNCEVVYVDGITGSDLFAEQNSYQYFFPQIRKILFEKSDEKSVIGHYRVKGINNGDYVYCIDDSDKTFVLPLTEIKVDISKDLKIGVIRFEMKYYGEKIPAEDKNEKLFCDALRINDIGRRLFSPSLKDDEIIMTAKKISIIKREQKKEQPSSKNLINTDDKQEKIDFEITFPTEQFSTEIIAIEKLLFGDGSKMKTVSILDDRMFTMSLVKDTARVDGIKNGQFDKNKDSWPLQFHYPTYIRARRMIKNERSEINKKEQKEKLYEFFFVDSPGECSCKEERLLDKALEEHSYNRWLDYSTVYGLSEYSFVMLTTEDVPNHLVDAFLTTYVNMSELVLLQRAALVRLDIDASKAVPDDDFMIENIKELQKNNMFFENNIYAEEVTFQQQGIEIYDMLKKFLRIKVLKGEVEKKINNLKGYISTQRENRNKDIQETISNFAFLSLLTDVFIMFIKSELSKHVVLSVCLLALLGINLLGLKLLCSAIRNRKLYDRNLRFTTAVYLFIIIANALYFLKEIMNFLNSANTQ